MLKNVMQITDIEFDGSKIPSFANGRSLNQIAIAAGITRQFMTDIVKGRCKPSTDTALRIAKVLGCSVEDLASEKKLLSV